ncbi:hypothetical protein [Campylobacter sp. RM12647]|uniref:hypothetical protein n=1 Tax=Campylobacter sp. RM12647 TaxID=2735737 RepID=UPI001D7E2AA6|nr:hypothetical protein [Campylobacter sp. RM12647]
MRNKLSLSLLTCLAISGGGYLHAEFFDVACKDTNDCVIKDTNLEIGSTKTINSLKGTNSSVKITSGLTANKIELVGTKEQEKYNNTLDISGKTKIDNLILDNMNIENNSSFQSSAVIKNSIYTHGKLSHMITNFDKLDITDSKYIHIGTMTDTIKDLFVKDSNFESQGGHLYFNNISKADGLVIDITNAGGGATIQNKAKDDASVVKKTQVNIYGGKFNLESGTSVNDLKIAITMENGDVKKKGWLNIEGKYSGDNGITISGLEVEDEGKITIGNNVKINDSVINIKDTADLVWLDGKADFNNVNISKATSTPTSHNIVVKDNSNITFTNSNLTNLSINANSVNDKNATLNIVGGKLVNTGIGTEAKKSNLVNVNLNGVAIDNSNLSTDNIIAQNVTLNNITTSNNANINAKTKLDIKNSKIDNTNKLTATNAEIGTSTIGADINVTNELKATNGANLNGSITSGTIIAENGSIFNGTTTATDKITSSGAIFDGEVTAKDLESSNNSKFNNNITISNSITSSDTTFAKNVSANTITSTNSVFNGTTTANDKITSNGATFNGLVKANELEANLNSNFDINSKVEVNTLNTTNSIFSGSVNASNSINSTGSTFKALVNTSSLTTDANSVFSATSKVNVEKLTANSTNFQGLVDINCKNTDCTSSLNNSKFNELSVTNATISDTFTAHKLTANDKATFEKDIKSDFITANSGSKFVGTTTATNKITSSGATFDGVVEAKDLESSKNSIFNNNITASNSITSSDTTFAKNVSANTITSTNSVFNGTTTATDSITANSGSKFVGNVSATNKITSNGATFEKEVKTAFLDAQKGSIFNTTSIVNATDINAVGSTFNGSIVKNNSITADSSTFANAIDTATLTAKNNSSFANVTANTITSTNSVFNGTTTATDSIIANGGSTFNGFVSANNITSEKSVFNKEVNVKDTLKSNNSTFNSIVNANTIEAVLDTTFSKDSKVNANTINTSKSIFDGEVVVSNLNALNTKFNGATTIDCKDNTNCKSDIKASYFNDLTLKNNAKITLDEGSSANNLTLLDDTTYLALNGKSQITGDIKNEGIIEIVDGTISSKITGNGDLISNKVVYTNDVELSDIKGSGGKFGGITTTTNDVSVDNTTFEKDLNVGKTLYANQGNQFSGKVSATDAIFSLDTSKSMEKGNVITANQVDITKDLNIKDLNVTAENIKSNSARITNSTINSSNINSNLVNIANSTINSKLLGKDDSSSNVYDANIQKDSGTYTTKQSELNGSVRVDKLDTTNTHIKGQVAVNTLVANNSKFYIYGGGIDTSFHDIYSGAIIVREAISGANNTIQLANTNLTMLKDKEGFIPIAIVNNTTNSQRSDANSQSGISKDFFKVTYQTKVANYELADRFTHFNPNAKGNAIWSIGIKGDDLIDESNVDSVISGQDLGNIANGANSNNVNTSSLEVVLGDMFDLIDFDKDAVGTANFILTSPDYIANTKNNTLNNRLRLVKNQKVGNGFWLDNQMGYNKYEYSSIRYKNFNVGADKTNELSNSNLTLGVAASFGTAETKGNVDANSDSKGIGLYAMNVFNNGVFIGANAFYHNISSSYEADKLGIKADKNHNVYTASFESGVRFGDKYYFEPSLRYDLTSYKPTAISTNGLSISGDSQLKHTLSAKLEGGVSMLDSLDGFLSVALSKELTKKPDMLLIDEVKENIIEGKKGDTSVNLNFGVDYKINPNASFNINLGSNLYTNSDKELKGSLGFSYKF